MYMPIDIPGAKWCVREVGLVKSEAALEAGASRVELVAIETRP